MTGFGVFSERGTLEKVSTDQKSPEFQISKLAPPHFYVSICPLGSASFSISFDLAFHRALGFFP